jgi:branched-chain amino acid transport system permease protein
MLKGKMVNLKKILPILLILIVLAFAPYFLQTYYLLILMDVLVFVALSISWHFFSALTKYIALGSTAFVGTGLYFTARYLQASTAPLPGQGFTPPILPLPVVILLGGLICFAAALAIGSVTLRLKGIYFAIVTFGVSQVFSGAFALWETKISQLVVISIPLHDNQTVYYSILIAMLAVLLLTTFLRRSKFGLAMRMIGENEEAAVHVGVNTSLTKILGFAISAMCMGFIGGSYALKYPSTMVDNAFSNNYTFLPAVMTMLGGVGTVYGPIIGSIFLELLWDYLQVTITQLFLIILGLILIVIILFMPNGIMGVLQQLKARFMGRKKLAKAPKMPP